MLRIFRGRKRTFPGSGWPPRESVLSRRDLTDDHQPSPLGAGDRNDGRRTSAERLRSEREVVSKRTRVEHAETADLDEWQAPLERDRRRGKRPGDGAPVGLTALTASMLLGPPADDLDVRKRLGLLR